MLKKMQLKNGLDVFFFKTKKAPVVSVRMWVKTGSADEKKGEEGISHFIEHLVFKGSKNLGVGDAAKKIEGAGGQLNAYTSFDETVFHVTMYKDQLDVGLEVISEMLGYPTFDPVEVDNEREVVIEEIKRSMDNPGRLSSRLLFSTMYKKHPYGIPVIGYEKNIENVTVETIKDYYNRRYVPKNMFLVVTGDFDLPEAKKLVKSYYQDIPDRKLGKVKRNVEPAQKTTRTKVVQSSFKQNVVHFSWPIPKITHKDIAALDMLAMVLGQNESSLFNQKLRLEEAVVRYAYSSLFATKDKGFFNITLSVDKENIQVATEKLLECMEEFFAKSIDEDLIQISKSSLESDEVFTYETVDGISKKIGYYEYNFLDPDYSETYLERIKSLEEKDLFKAFKKYLLPEKLNLTIFSEEDDEVAKKIARKWNAKYKRKFKTLKAPRNKENKARKKSKKLGSLKKNAKIKMDNQVLSNGLRVFTRLSNEIPVVNVRTAFLAGLRYEPDRLGGLSELTTNCWANENKNLTEKEMAKFIELRSSGMSSFSGKNTNGMTMTTLTPYFQDVLNVYLDTVLEPKFSDKMVEREKLFMLQSIKQQSDNPAQECIRGFMSTMFEGHAYGKKNQGTEESLSKINASNVSDFYKTIRSSNRVSFCLSGDLKGLDKVIQTLEERYPKIKKVEDRLAPSHSKKITEDKYFYKKSEKEQTHLLVGQEAVKMADPKRYVLDVIQAVLAGQGGRLFLELRDKNSMAYSLSPMRMDGIDGGFFGAYIACSPEKSKKAIKMLDAEFQKLCQDKVSEEELKRAKQYIIGKYHIELQKNSAFTSSIIFSDIYGIPYEEVFKYQDHITNVSANDVMSLAKEIFSRPKVFSAVGATKPW